MSFKRVEPAHVLAVESAKPAGGIVWATLVGLIAYFVGDRAAKAISTYRVATT